MHLGFEVPTLVKDRNSLSHNKGLDQDIKAIRFRVLGTWYFQGGDASAAEASGAELLRRRQLLSRIQNESRWHGADQFIVGGAEFWVEVRHGQIQNAQERAFEGEDEVRIAWRSAQLSIGGRKQGFRFEQCRHLAVRRVKHREGMRSVIPTAALEGSDGGQGRVTPPVGNDPIARLRV